MSLSLIHQSIATRRVLIIIIFTTSCGDWSWRVLLRRLFIHSHYEFFISRAPQMNYNNHSSVSWVNKDIKWIALFFLNKINLMVYIEYDVDVKKKRWKGRENYVDRLVSANIISRSELVCNYCYLFIVATRMYHRRRRRLSHVLVFFW
jgi:hypothetical protein